jgi:hypothetical protein
MISKQWNSLLIVALAGTLSACADLERGDSLNLQSPENDAAAFNDGAAPLDGGAPLVDYATQVYPLLERDCRDCHRQGGEAGATALVLSGNADADRSMLSALSNQPNPRESRLLTKATGRSHQGGVVFNGDSETYRIIFYWIGQGANP